MRIHYILLAFLCETLAITVHYDIKGTVNQSTKENKDTLRDIRLVPINQVQSRQKTYRTQQEPVATSEKPTAPPNQNYQIKSRRERKKYTNKLSRIGHSDSNSQADESHQNYMQKMADQLYIAQKHASLLSDYQKFIINQDPHVKSFVFGQTHQSRNPKPFSRSKQSGRALTVKANYVTPEPVTSTTTALKKIVVVTPKPPTTPEKISLLKNDHFAQSTDTKFVTLAPQPITHFVHTPELSKKLAIVPYHTPQPYTYYDLGVTHTPQVQEVQIPTNLGLGAYEIPRYHQQVKQEDEHHVDPKYEFMYKIKDHEKNNHFGHMESRTDKAVYGYYFVHLPDGRLETVKYWADKTGYHAKVDYEGEAKHPPTSTYKIHSQQALAHHG